MFSTRIFAITFALGCAITLGLSGCAFGPEAAAATPTLVRTATPVPTATPAFVVGVGTAQAIVRSPTPTPVPTRFVAPPGAYVSLSDRTGPVVGRVIIVRGGNLPTSQQVNIVWSPRGRGAGISTTAYTDKRGSFTQRYDVPAAQPGAYHISVEVSQVLYASADFRVVSAATVRIAVTPDSNGDRIDITGTRFQPRAHLLLVAYQFAKKSKPTVLGRTRADASGALRYQTTMRLAPGEYSLHVFSTDALTADMANTYFQIEV